MQGQVEASRYVFSASQVKKQLESRWTVNVEQNINVKENESRESGQPAHRYHSLRAFFLFFFLLQDPPFSLASKLIEKQEGRERVNVSPIFIQLRFLFTSGSVFSGPTRRKGNLRGGRDQLGSRFLSLFAFSVNLQFRFL